MNWVNVNFPLLYLCFIDITSNHQSFCTVFVTLPLSEMQFFQSTAVLGRTATWNTVLTSPSTLSLYHGTYGCCMRPPEFASETVLLWSQKHVYSESKYTLSDFQAIADHGGFLHQKLWEIWENMQFRYLQLIVCIQYISYSVTSMAS